MHIQGDIQMAAALRRDLLALSKEELVDRLLAHLPSGADTIAPPGKRRKTSNRPFLWSKWSSSKFALRVLYIGWKYHGVAIQQPNVATVESLFLEALQKTRLVPNDSIPELDFSRCGRTDAGVSARSQVFALSLRCNPNGTPLNYTRILNGVLPNDIRVTGYTPVPTTFNARFDCVAREYRYFFVGGEDVSLSAMQDAAAHFVGEHDFSLLCKKTEHVQNYRRTIFSAALVETGGSSGLRHFCFIVRGRAFLYHQVRCMVAILMLVGLQKEPAGVVPLLLKLGADCRVNRPPYEIASEMSLVLWDCAYEGISFPEEDDQASINTERILFESTSLQGSQFLMLSSLLPHKLSIENAIGYSISNGYRSIFEKYSESLQQLK